MIPEEIAIVYVPGQQWGNSPEAQGNNLADKAEKEAASIWNSKCSISCPLSRHHP
jgi:hypothetical protein